MQIEIKNKKNNSNIYIYPFIIFYVGVLSYCYHYSVKYSTVIVLMYIGIVILLYMDFISLLRDSRGGMWRKLIKNKFRLVLVMIWPITFFYYKYKDKKINQKLYKCYFKNK